jgi:hypothetical protein
MIERQFVVGIVQMKDFFKQYGCVCGHRRINADRSVSHGRAQSEARGRGAGVKNVLK